MFLKTAVLLVAVALLFTLSASGQQRFTPYPTPNLRFETPPPLLPTNVTANYSGAFGSNTFFYWVIAQHTRGASGLSVPARVRNVGTLAGGNPVIISWQAVNGANTYDVIRFTSTAIVLPCTACRVATGVTGTSTSDTGAALGAQTLAPIGFAEAVYRLDNSTFTTAQMVYELPPSGATFFPMVVSTTGGGGADQDIPCFQGAGGTLGPCDTGDFFWTPATFLLNFPTAGGITSPAALAADAGFVRLANAEVIAWEASPAGVDGFITFNVLESFQMSAPLELDATDPADSEALRLDNAEGIAWEAAPAGVDITLIVDAGEILQLAGSSGFNTNSIITEAGNPVPNDTDNLGFFAATTSAQLAGVLSDETGTLLVVFSDAPTFTTSTVSPIYVSADADPADAGAIRLGNAEIIAWEASPAGGDVTLAVDAGEIAQFSGAVNVGGALTEATNAVPNDTDTLDFFAATTSAEMITVISDETGSGLLTFATAPTFTTSVTVAGLIDISTAGSFTYFDSVVVASTATMTLPAGNLFHISGTDAITTMNTCDATNNGRLVNLIFDGALTFTEGNNLVLAGNFSTGATDTIQLACDATNWVEMSRSDN